MTSPTHEGRVEFFDPRFRTSRSVRFGLGIALCGFLISQMATEGDGLTGIVALYAGLLGGLIAVLLVGFVRSFRAGIEVDDDGVVVRTTYATKRWRFDELRGARLLDRDLPVRQQYFGALHPREERTRLVPVLVLRNGLDVRLYGLKVIGVGYLAQHWLPDAVEEINGRIALRRGRPTPT